MSEQTAEVAATETEGTEQQTEQKQELKPTETVDFWKGKAREQEKRAKDNAAAAKRLTEIEESQKSEAEKAADRIAKAEAEVASVPAKVSESLRAHFVEYHGIDAEDAELFLTATEPELLLKQVTRLLGQSGKRTKQLHVPKEGTNPKGSDDDPRREFLRGLGLGGH
ncbi:hypothetical protein DW322_08810 [Rhodococcus rhodnii]|uniref:Scaffolding protein n=2 Tax=Rhodococcus rhodnii TaxID=38312 RepID=R7WRI4_9NOCA|nr:hypothetical protein [Rhodococcus rhodnii]EOM77911.1 hypothetical protein Rrhod_0720 [Rhodococcus rhodnii LMG 5362]TXG90305.1 hypothetical protein DW322_08810 [Rhodococcus rhodnii]